MIFLVGTGLDWRPKSPVTSGHSNMEAVMSSISKLNLQEDQPVTIPDHLQVPEAGRAFPTFGSFGEDYDSNVNSADEHEDDKRSGISAEGNLPDEAAPLEQSNPTRLALLLWIFMNHYLLFVMCCDKNSFFMQSEAFCVYK